MLLVGENPKWALCKEGSSGDFPRTREDGGVGEIAPALWVRSRRLTRCVCGKEMVNARGKYFTPGYVTKKGGFLGLFRIKGLHQFRERRSLIVPGNFEG